MLFSTYLAGTGWFFVVSDRKLKERYAEHGRTLLRSEVERVGGNF